MSENISESLPVRSREVFSLMRCGDGRRPLTTRTAALLADVARAEGRTADAIRLIEIATLLAERDFKLRDRVNEQLVAFGVIDITVEGGHGVAE